MFGFETAICTVKVRTPVRRRAWNNHYMRLVGDELKFIADKGKDNGHARLTTEDLLADDWYVHTEGGAVPLPRISDTRLSELLDHATDGGQYDENSPGSDTRLMRPDHPMNSIRRATILAYKELQQRRAAD